MPKYRPSMRVVVATAALLLVLAAGCSSDEAGGDSASGDAPTTSTEAPASASPVTSAPRQTCDGANLAAAAAGPLPGASLTDIVCETRHAVATWEASAEGPVIVLFTLQDGVWTYVASGPVGGDVAGLAPADFSTTAIPEWQRKREAVASRAKAREDGVAPSRGGSPAPTSYVVDPDTGQVQACTADGDNLTCKPAPGVPPEAATAPPEPAAPSMFCKYNYNDPRCVADNQFTP